MDEPIWTPTVFTKNRDRLLNQEMARSFFRRVSSSAPPLMSDEHFTVDGTLIEAWASQKSFQPKDGPPDGDGRTSTARRARTTRMRRRPTRTRAVSQVGGAEARLAYLGHLLIENRHGLIVDAMATEIEPAFGWLSTIAWMRKVKLRGLAKVNWLFRFASAAFNLRGSSRSGPCRHERLVAAPRRALAREPTRVTHDPRRAGAEASTNIAQITAPAGCGSV